jgi:FkbM family methyltransferase
MKLHRRKMEELLWVSGLHPLARSMHSAILGRRAAVAQGAMTNFFRKLLPPDELVFDIGANSGVMSKTFASIGARVVALEPNADCARHIQLSYSGKQIEVVQAAAGPRNGLAVLNISDEWDLTSSLSEDWMEAIQKKDERYRGNWPRKSVVPLLTLDALIEHFGLPYFIKIDVEGFEEQVLSGLSIQPRLLSFEFHHAFIRATLRCLDLDVFAPGSTFNLASNSPWGYPARLDSEIWLQKEELRQRLLSLPDGDNQGDIFVRAPQAAPGVISA